jgi:hypothetical protein
MKSHFYKQSPNFYKQSPKINWMTAVIVAISFSACSKQTNNCQEWEVTYDCTINITGPIGSCGIVLDCGGTRTMNALFCGDQLKDAKPGNTITIGQDQCSITTMTFNRQIK